MNPFHERHTRNFNEILILMNPFNEHHTRKG